MCWFMQMQVVTSVVSSVAAVLLVAAAAAAAPTPTTIGLPGCRTSCGNVSVPYPFGIGGGCYHKGFNLTCVEDGTGRPPRLLLGDGSLQVLEISIANATVRVIHTGDVKVDGDGGHGAFLGGVVRSEADGPFALSADRNELVVKGCNVKASLEDTMSNYSMGGCSSYCLGTADGFAGVLPGGGDSPRLCSGILCCQAPLTALHRVTAGKIVSRVSYDVQLTPFGPNGTDGRRLRSRVLVAEVGWLDQSWVIDELLREAGAGGPPTTASAVDEAVPVVLEWEVVRRDAAAGGTTTTNWSRECPVDEANTICKSRNSRCVQGSGYKGYGCVCARGYDGSPYVSHGCQDINECELPAEENGCFGTCYNTQGSYECRCRPGTQGNPMVRHGCVKTVNTGLIIGVSLAVGPGLLLLVAIATLIMRKLRHRRATMLKQKFFIQNRGQLLEQLVSHRSGIAEKMIIPLDELEKATNHFDQARQLGVGGHGIVYKGILSDLHVVAIKKSKIVVQKDIDEFINEVAILSQINHRNVVKLYGCCLETEVPLLAYEFISNGTLSDHLHQKSATSIPWGDRLRIACEVGKAISYLHSAVSIPIIHRDIKSANILLDDALTAKVSDFGASRYISIDQTGITTTAVQGTIGYLDPMYYYTGRLSEKSDVYSFGVLLVELLTRKMPIKYRSSKDDGLVIHFVELLEEGKLVDILDLQVAEEGGSEVKEVAALAASCIKLKEDERPTMRQVEMALEGLQATKERVPYDLQAGEGNNVAMTRKSTSLEEVSRRYSQEEFSLSSTYPR